MFPQLGSPLIAITPVIGIVHSDRHCRRGPTVGGRAFNGAVAFVKICQN
jgi:hypothetical protein